ncbi:MAG: acyl-CoA dehydrogenase family protein [Phycisphaerae bacterium]|nr:acyl-CoA dehydrogenase family protein [Phycisphaerae bacterium]
MANFYTDNDDIRFLFRHYQLTTLADIMEGDYSDGQTFDWAPQNADEAVDNYDRILEVVGQISGDFIDPRAEQIDLLGNTLNDDGTVTYSQGMQENIDVLTEAQLMGFTLPHRFGGLNCPNLIYTMNNEVVSRADASLMNLYGLQGIAETINAFASEEIKQEYLRGFAEGGDTGAMVLTEPDAGSDLQAIKLRAHQDENGQWILNGVKRFITNGCGEVLLVLARSEPERSGGLGLSLFVCRRSEAVKIRRLENKLGIKGSPTCEMIFKDMPCKLVGERQRGLVTYVMALMNGARVGIAAQSLGIAEAAYRIARDYAASRKQFGTAIEQFPAVRDMLIEMKLDIEVARSITYETCWWVDHNQGLLNKLASSDDLDKASKKELKQASRKYKRMADMMTPISKYYGSEMCNRVCYDSIQVLGGSGYMKDYPVERHARDARITTIYEGTSQLQIIAAVRGVCSTAVNYLQDKEAFAYPAEVQDLVDKLIAGREQLQEAIAFIKEKPGTEYMDLHGRKLVDAAILLMAGHLLLQQSVAAPAREDDFTRKPSSAGSSDNGEGLDTYRAYQARKGIIARRYISNNAAKVTMLCEQIRSDDRSSITQYDVIVGPVPEA